MLLAARALQGVGGALASPAVLALIVTSFPEGRERTRALGIYMGVITGGSSLGLVLGGVITEWLSYAASHPLAGLTPFAQSQHVLTHGMATAFGFAAILDVCSLLVILTLIRTLKLAPVPVPASQSQEKANAS